jgi:hypothetical protein
MANISLFLTANLGASNTGVSGSIGYRLVNTLGTETLSRTNSGVFELSSGSGIYGANVSIDTHFSGSVIWDRQGTSVFAAEEVSSAVDTRYTRYLTDGRWKIEESTKQMVFYAPDNTTELIRYNLKDRNENLSFEEVFHRTKVN